MRERTRAALPRPGLERELQELERTDPAVAKAAKNYERVRDEIIARGRPPPLTLERLRAMNPGRDDLRMREVDGMTIIEYGPNMPPPTIVEEHTDE